MPPAIHSLSEGVLEIPMEQCSRSLDFWYDEGTVILRIENILFRIHRGVLSEHSDVFKDAFAMQPPSDINLYEGCQVMTLNHDSVQDWTVMLAFIYRPLKYDFLIRDRRDLLLTVPFFDRVNPMQKNLPVDALFSLMRLGPKYMFDDVFNTCLERLLSEFPVTLATFDGAHPLRMLGAVSETDDLPSYTRDAGTLISVINQAVDLEIRCVLPCAYYLMISRFPLQDITKGVVIPGGTHVMLSQMAKISILTGMAKIHPSLVKRFDRFYKPGGNAWTRHCDEETAMSEIETGGREPWPDCTAVIPVVQGRLRNFCTLPLFALASCRSGEIFSSLFSGLCKICHPVEMKLLQEDRERFWQGLPAFFEVGEAWVDLKHHPGSVD